MKTNLVQAFRYYLVPSLRLGMLVFEAPPLLLAAEPLLSCISSRRLETRF
ncbi:hypothetical protein [Nostoc sp.]